MSEKLIKTEILRRPDWRPKRRELSRVARDYVLKCERYDQKLTALRDENGYAVLLDPAQKEDSAQHAKNVLARIWEYTAELGYDKGHIDWYILRESQLMDQLSWQAYLTMDRPDLRNEAG